MDDFSEARRQLLLTHLRRHVDAEVRFDPPSRRLYATDASLYQVPPLGVVIPRSRDGLLAAVQVALETRTPVVPRGGGTSLSGQAIGPGVVIDTSKYLNRLIELDPAARVARVEPGLVLDEFNRLLAPHQLQFGPDVSTASRATLGGMIGNNSAGSRSLVYGKTGDHVAALEVILSDGACERLGPLDAAAWAREPAREGVRGQASFTLQEVLRRHAAEIRERFPRILRRVSGYNLLDYLEPPRATSLIPLLVGSEGTLGVVASAEVRLVPRPRFRGLLVPHFDSLQAALDAVRECLDAGPSAVELLDAMLIQLARTQPGLREVMQSIHGEPAALLMVEFQSDSEAFVRDAVEKLGARLRGARGMTQAVPAVEASLRDPLWNLRRAAVPLLYGLPGGRKPVAFVEDTAVAPQRLPEFARRFREVLREHGTDGAFYGHASVGCLHIRPVLNLQDPADLQRMRRIAAGVTDLVLEFGGSLSGEHGDGLARSQWNRKMFGEAVYQAFRQVKRSLDPQNLFNPGKVVDAPAMTEHLRAAQAPRRLELPTVFDYSGQEGFFASVERCNGSGVCRKLQGGAMCPSFRATRDERDSTRGRANALRHALSTPAPEQARPEGPLQERWLWEVMDLCLGCKACKRECPSNVDLAKLKSEFLQAYYQKHLRPARHYLAAALHRWQPRLSPVGPLLNWLHRRAPVRWLIEKTLGLDRRRAAPALRRLHFRRWFARRPALPAASRRVLLFDDCFTTFQEPQIPRAAVQLLEASGAGVELVGPVCCGRTLLSQGFVREARQLVQQQLPALAARVRAGLPILGLEPSCLYTLADEWRELVPGEDAETVAAAVQSVEGWLHAHGNLRLHPPRHANALLHGHCHQSAHGTLGGTERALRQIPSLQLATLDAGCCGMAGVFGYEKDHYDLSVRIANLALLPALAAEPDATVLATGTSCRHQIRDLTGRAALHPVELLWQCLTPPPAPAAPALAPGEPAHA